MKKNKQFVFLLFTLFVSGFFLYSQSTVSQVMLGFDVVRDGIPHGIIDTVMYTSKTEGANRKTLFYTPPGSSKEKKHPVLYLLYGIGGNEKEWFNVSHPQVIPDKLIILAGR